MEIKADHRIEFEIEEGGDFVIPSIPNPSYIYKEGDKFKLYQPLSEEKEAVAEFEVTAISHELFDAIVGEQVIICHVRKIDD